MAMVYGRLNPPTEVYAKVRSSFQAIYKQQSLPISYFEQIELEQPFLQRTDLKSFIKLCSFRGNVDV